VSVSWFVAAAGANAWSQDAVEEREEGLPSGSSQSEARLMANVGDDHERAIDAGAFQCRRKLHGLLYRYDAVGSAVQQQHRWIIG
jgi:hypothetical protein